MTALSSSDGVAFIDLCSTFKCIHCQLYIGQAKFDLPVFLFFYGNYKLVLVLKCGQSS